MLFIFEFVAYMLQEKAVSIPNLLKMLIFVSTDWQTDGAIILPLAVHARARDNNMMCLASRTDSVCFGHNSVLFLAEHNPQIYAWSTLKWKRNFSLTAAVYCGGSLWAGSTLAG